MNTEARQGQLLAQHLSRVLLVDASVSGARITTDILKDLGAARITVETSGDVALELCRQAEPRVIITELHGPSLDGLKFVRALRRSNFNCRRVPVIVITASATAAALAAARNAGVHEFMCKPFTIRDLRRRLEAVTLHKRDWVEAVGYIGPDRRRFNAGDYKGPRKRGSDAAAPGFGARIEQALRILAAAIKAIESDPMQAMRAMNAQAADLSAVAAESQDAKLMAGVGALQRCLIDAATSGRLSRAAIEGGAAALLALLPSDKAADERLELDVA